MNVIGFRAWRTGSFAAVMLAVAGAARGGTLSVVSTSPAMNEHNVPVSTPISVTFDRPVSPASFTVDSFYAFGKSTGLVAGPYTFSNGDQTVTLTSNHPFVAGEMVTVVMSHDLTAADASPLRSSGYSFQFMTRARPADLLFAEHQTMSNVTCCQTRIYGAAAADLNGDGYLDLTTVNEVSADLRVFLNSGDGQGTYDPVLLPPLAIGVEASPNETADFDRDGNIDMVVGASSTDDVWIALGNGDGTYASPAQSVNVGSNPHGVTVLDVDGDGDLDIINANCAGNNLSLMINDGSGVFGTPTFFDPGLNCEYAVAAGDMDEDGLLDVVVASRDSQEIMTLHNNGDGTFTNGAVQSSGGSSWVVVLGDLNNDGHLDATTANSFSGNAAAIFGNGDGTFASPVPNSIGAHTVSTDLGDLDGDGDLDWVISSFGGGFWRVFLNDGSGNFSFLEEFTATANPSCSILLDVDGDRDLDIALTDEIADTVRIEKNSGSAALGDVDHDGNVDGDDHLALVACFSGSGVDAGLACGDVDFDGDGDVDCFDQSAFEDAWTEGGSAPTLESCGGTVPTMSEYGFVVTMLLLLSVASIVFRGRATATGA